MLIDIVEKAYKNGASDIHITYGYKPYFRINGVIFPQEDFGVCTAEVIEGYIQEILSLDAIDKLDRDKQLDCAYDAKFVRCRVNIFMQGGNYDIVIRLIDNTIRSIDELGLNPVLKEISNIHSGLVLVTGVTGSGKSTTIASMIEYINQTKSRNIITLEDPVEYIYKPKRCIIRQRELGRDVISFENGLKACLREDPDIIVLGEMRDLETIASAITLAETGHLVFATLHTRSAAETIDRILDVFPPEQQQQIRIQLTNVLESIISQILVPKKSGGRIATMEIMRMTTAIRNTIRTRDNISKIKDEIFFNKTKLGTQTMTQCLADYYLAGKIDRETAIKYSESEESFIKLTRSE